MHSFQIPQLDKAKTELHLERDPVFADNTGKSVERHTEDVPLYPTGNRVRNEKGN